MKREILFRGKRISGKEWVYGSLISWPDGDTEICESQSEISEEMSKYFVYPETVGQFTGLTDKNGIMIFEWDIISYIMADGGSAKGIIKQGEYGTGGSCHVGFGVNWYNRHDTGWLRVDLGFWAKFREIEVIGNIHDNPELLEGGVDNG